MSKVIAYRCDFCGLIKPDRYITGINPTEDMFNTLEGYPVVTNNEKTGVHICTDCYNENVMRTAGVAVNRKRNEDEYKAKLKELAYSVKKQCVRNVATGKKVFP